MNYDIILKNYSHFLINCFLLFQNFIISFMVIIDQSAVINILFIVIEWFFIKYEYARLSFRNYLIYQIWK